MSDHRDLRGPVERRYIEQVRVFDKNRSLSERMAAESAHFFRQWDRQIQFDLRHRGRLYNEIDALKARVKELEHD